MARYRTIKPEIWVDGWFESLNDKTRLFWIFLLTSHQTEPSGLYKWSRPIAQVLLKCSRRRLDALCVLVQDAEKAHFEGEWVYIPNFLRHQPAPNTRIWHSIALQIQDAPKCLLRRWLSKHYTRVSQALGKDTPTMLSELNGVDVHLELNGVEGKQALGNASTPPPEKSPKERLKGTRYDLSGE